MKPTKTQLSQLMIEKLMGIIGPEDDLVIEKLLLEDDAVREEWKQLQQLESSGALPKPNVDARWQELRHQMKIPAKTRIFSLPRIAAAVAIAICVSVFYYIKPEAKQSSLAAHETPNDDRVYLQSETGDMAYVDVNQTLKLHGASISAKTDSLSFIASNAPGLTTLSVPRAKNYLIKLSDGTRISMNSKTILRFPFQFPGNTREVYLEGEAFFKVAKDKAHPFIVHANGNEIQVLGTEFNVNTYDSLSVKTALLEGSVRASNRNSTVQLKPGFEATSSPDREFRINKFDPAEVLSWMQGRFYFHNSSLQDLSSLLSRWYKVSVVFQNPEHMKKRFSGEILKNQSVEFFLDNLRLSNNIPLKYKNGIVVFQ